jgi:hypothetical protein
LAKLEEIRHKKFDARVIREGNKKELEYVSDEKQELVRILK